MTRYHLTITIFNPFFEKSLNSRGKIDSVWFADYSYFFEKILNDLSFSEINKFRLNLFNFYGHQLSYLRVSQFMNGGVYNGFCIVSHDFNVSSCIIAFCLPNRKIRDKYFDYDILREKYYIKPDFISYLKN